MKCAGDDRLAQGMYRNAHWYIGKCSTRCWNLRHRSAGEVCGHHAFICIPLFATNATRKEKIKKEKLQWAQLYTMANYAVSETTTVRTITINVCKINTAVKLRVQHGQKMTPKMTFFQHITPKIPSAKVIQMRKIHSTLPDCICNIFIDSKRL